MVLDDVACGTDAVVVAGAPTDADVLGLCDLHVVDVVAIPDGLEHRVGKPDRKDVLDRLLAEVVVNAEDLVGRERLVEHLVERLCTGKIAAEGLLDDDSAPFIAGRVGETGLAQVGDDDREEAGRDGQVEDVVAHRAALGVECVDLGLQAPIGLGILYVTGDESDSGAELRPNVLAERRTRVFPDRVVDLGREVLISPLAPGESDESETWRQEAAVGEVVDGRHDLLACEITGDAEEDHAARTGNLG